MFIYLYLNICGVTQGNPLPPTLFNIVIDAVIRHWVTVVEPNEDGRERLGVSIQDLAAYFYAYDGLVTLNQLERLQRAFSILTGLFDRFGLRTNMRKTVSMACQPYHAPGRMSLEAYERQTTGTGKNLREC